MSSGAYSQVGAKLVERGYAAIPIMPNTKRPGELKRGEWIGKTKWRDEYTRRLPSRFEVQLWSQTSAGVCVVCGPASKDIVGVDIDTDDATIRAAVMSAIPQTTVSKRGQKGDTRFFRAPNIDKSKSWNLPTPDGEVDENGKRKTYRVCDLIGPGRQTLLPPTIHPDTKEPYVWTGPDTLEDMDPSELPELTPEHVEAISAALAGLGYEAEPERAPLPTGSTGGDYDLPIHRHLNNAALENLSKWVPFLGLRRCKPTHLGYEAVAVWRASNTGQEIARRKLNLKISRQGIVDFGDGPRTYTPINLIIAAMDLGDDVDRAFGWLADALGWNDDVISLPLTVEAASEAEADIFPEPQKSQAVILSRLAEVASFEPKEIDGASKPVAGEGAIEALTHCKGLVGQIVDWIEKTARRPNRTLALGAAVTVVGTLIGRRVAGPTRSATHLYVLGLAPTGSGKQHPIDAVSRLMRSAKAGHHIGPSEFISMPAVINMLQRQPLAVCAQDEFGSYLKRILNRRASGFENGISKILRTVWGTSFSEYMTPEWAGRSASAIQCPALSIYGVSTPDEFYDALQDGELKNGFLNRFLVISTGRPAAVVPELEPGEVPSSIVEGLSALYRWGNDDVSMASARLNHDTLNPPPIQLRWASQQASRAFVDFEKYIESLIEKNENIEHFIGRSPEIAIRLATIRTVGRWGPYGDTPMIDLSDVEWGRDIALSCGMSLATEAKLHMAENERQAWSNRILGVIRKKGTASQRAIQQHVRNAIKGGDLKDILESLCEQGAIEKIKGEKLGRLTVSGYKFIEGKLDAA